MGIYKKGNNWYIDYYHKGRRKRKKVGPSKKLAEKVLSDVQVRLAKGDYLGVYEEKKELFSEFAPKYLDFSRANKANTSYIRDVTSLNNILPVFGEKYLYEIDSQMVEGYKIARLRAGKTPATINRELSCLKHLFSKAIEWECVRENPVKGVKMMKEPPGRIRYLEKDEIERLLGAMESLPRDSGRYLRPVVVTALNTGFRKREILRLKWQDIHFEDRKITVLRTKTNELRTVPMNETLYNELKRVRKTPGSDYVFSHKNGDPYDEVRKSFDRALKAAGITGFRFHDLRHTFASHLVMNGCDIRTVQQLMGHKDIKMTMRYSHLSRGHLQDAVGRLDNLWSLYGHQGEIKGKERGRESIVSADNTGI